MGCALKKAAQNMIDNRGRVLHLRGTLTFGLFICDVIVAAGGHVVLKSCHGIQPPKNRLKPPTQRRGMTSNLDRTYFKVIPL